MLALVWIGDLVYNALVALGRLTSALAGRRPAYVLIEIAGPYPEHRPRRQWWMRGAPDSVEDLRRRFEALRATPWVAGVVLTVGDLAAGVAGVQALRAAVAAYRRAGGRVAAYLPQASTLGYYLAAAADVIVMPESATLDLVGLTAQATFLREALDRLGVRGELESVGAYKNAAETLTRDSMSPPAREALSTVLDAMFEDVVAGIAEGRRLDPARVRDLIDRAPLSAAAAREAGLIDAVAFEDELPGRLWNGDRGSGADRGGRTGRRPPALVPWTLARRRTARPFRRRTPGPSVAVVALRGPIQMGESRGRSPVPLPFAGRETVGHATVARVLRAVERSRRFGAAILCVDSPGGSALASDLIWREVQRVAQRKPVVAFFENVAGSGGYYAACAARRIICRPGTITGSIGVIAGKVNVAALAERAGVRREILVRGAAAAIVSPFVPFTPEERRRVRALADECYQRFVDRVAAGRGLARDAVLAAAQGRIWTGRQAQRLGLVDALGDFPAAVEAAKHLMGLPASAVVPVVPVRAPRAVAVAPARPAAEEAAAWLRALLQERVLALMPWDIAVG